MSAIPNLTREHVNAALRRIDSEGVPTRREATRFQLVVGKKRYPPKYVLSLAAAEAGGRQLRPDEFSGGEETNRVLTSLGYEIVGAEAPPLIARIVTRGRPASSVKAAAEMLLEAFGAEWAAPGQVKFTITSGGFVEGELLNEWDGGKGWNSLDSDLPKLVRIARPLVEAVLTPRVVKAAQLRTQVLTIGVDLDGDGGSAELVAIVNAATGKVVGWTGKSYPTPRQQAHLVQVTDPRSHLFELAGERVLVLGCHDLNMFSARAIANQSPDGVRRARCDDMARVARRFRPTVVLQHPHSTDTPNIWRMPWACLARDYPSVHTYASGVGYYSNRGRPRQPLHAVLAGTRSSTGVVDVIVNRR
jgi:hypothetical protein